MGNSNQAIGSQLRFIQVLPDRHFGEVEIYQNEEGRFIMKTLRTHISNDKLCLEFRRIMEWVGEEGHRMVVPVLSTVSQHQKNICVQYEITSLYQEYYNYTLMDLMVSKKELEEGELWLLFDEMLQLVTVLKREKIGINLELDNVFLTLKGTPAVYIHHLLSFQNTICSSLYGMGQLVAKIMLQLVVGHVIEENQQVQRIQEGKEFLVPLAKMCGKFKTMGRMVRQLLYRQRPQSQISQEIKGLLLENKIKKATEIKLIKFKYLIPDRREDTEKKAKEENKVTEHQIGKQKTKKSANKANSQLSQTKSVTSVSSNATEPLKEREGLCMMEKEGLQKMLAGIAFKKQQNIQKMQKFQQRKDELIHNSVKGRQDKQNLGLARSNLRQSQKRKGQREQRSRRVTESTTNYNRIR